MGQINARMARCSLTALLLLLVGCSPADRTATPPQPPDPVRPSQPSPPTQPTNPVGEDPSPYLRDAQKLLEKGEHKRAAEEFIRIAGRFPGHAPAWTLLGQALLHLNYPDVAAMVGERSLRLAPDSGDAQFNTGLAYGLGDSHPGRAVAHLAKAVRLGHPRAGYVLGGLYEKTGKPEKAAETYRQALAASPSDPDLKRAQAAVAGDLNMDGKAEQLSLQATTVIVRDGATGEELLRWADPAADPSEIWTAGVVDLGGENPALLAAGPNRASVFVWQKGGLVGTPPIEGAVEYRPVERALLASRMGQDRSYLASWAMQDGRLTALRRWEEAFDPPAVPPTSLLELFVAANRLQAHAFARPEQVNEVLSRVKTAGPDQVRAAFLLPNAQETYRLELDVEGKTVATAAATLAKGNGMQIEQLQWR